jgi:hypothetical protein
MVTVSAVIPGALALLAPPFPPPLSFPPQALATSARTATVAPARSIVRAVMTPPHPNRIRLR